MRLLYANGCSMTQGAELSDPASSAYPALIAAEYGMTLHNDAQGGASNCRVLRTSLLWLGDYLMKGGRPHDLFVLIGWTGPDRREFGLSSQEHSSPDEFWRSMHIRHPLANAPPAFVQLRELVISSFWCDRESMARYLVAINSLQGFLASRRIPHCFNQVLPVAPLHPELMPMVPTVDRERFFGFMDPDRNFFAYAKRAKAPAGPGQHPLDDGHRLWARELSGFIRENHLL